MRILRLFAITLAALVISAPSASSAGPDVSIRPEPVRDVVSADIKSVVSSIVIPSSARIKAEFDWTAPDGASGRSVVKLCYPRKGADSVICTDEFPAPSALGFPQGRWTVDISLPDRKLSKSFILTKNRQILAAANATKDEKLRILSVFVQDDGAEVALGLFAGDADSEVRAAVCRPLAVSASPRSRELLRSLQADASPEVRREAFVSLYSLEGPTSVDVISKTAGDTDAGVRSAAASRTALTDATKDILGALVRDPDTSVRMAAYVNITAHEGPLVGGVLSEALKVDDPAFRRSVVGFLSRMTGRTGASLAGTMDKDAEIRLRSIGLAESARSAEPIRPLVNDPEEIVAVAALSALARLGDVKGLELAAVSTSLSVRQSAVAILAGLPDAAGAYGLQVMVHDAQPDIRMTALLGLIKLGMNGVPGLIAALDDPDRVIRLDAVTALMNIKTPEVAVGMRRMLNDTDATVRMSALEYIISSDGAGVVPTLSGLACIDDAAMKNRAIETLTPMRGEESSAALGQYYNCGDDNIRLAVVGALSERYDPVAEGWIKTALNDKSSAVRLQAATLALARGMFETLAGLYADAEADIRRLAATAIAATPSPAQLPRLRALVGDVDPAVRLLALEALKGIPGDEAGEAVSSKLTDIDPAVSLRARAIILGRRDNGVTDALIKLAASDIPLVRHQAFSALKEIPDTKANAGIYATFKASVGGERIEALLALYDRAAAQTTTALSEAVSDADSTVRYAALEVLKNRTLDEVFYEKLAASEFLEVKRAGYYALWDIKGKGYAGSLLRGLREPDGDIRKAALNQLIKAGDPSLAENLGGLLSDPDADIRAAAMSQVLALPDGKPKADLLVLAADGEFAELVYPAVEGLLSLGDARALPFFDSAFAADRWKYAEAIAKVPGPAAINSLDIAYKNSSDDERLRVYIIKAVKGRGDGAVRLLSAALSDESKDVRYQATVGLAAIGAEATEPLGVAMKDADGDINSAALTALLDINTPQSLLIAARGITDPALRDAVLAAFTTIRKASAYLMSAHIDTTPSPFREKLAESLVATLTPQGGPDAAAAVLPAGANGSLITGQLAAESFVSRSQAEQAAAVDMLFDKGLAKPGTLRFAAENIHNPAVLKELAARAVGSGDAAKRDAVFDPVLHRHAPYDLPAILEGLGSTDTAFTINVAEGLAAVSSAEADKALPDIFVKRPELRPALWRAAKAYDRAELLVPVAVELGDLSERLHAAEMLKNRVSDDTGRLILTALKDKDESVRLHAAEAASTRPDTAPFMLMASDNSPRLRKLAATALGRTDGPETANILLRLVLDKDAEVSNEASGSLTALGDKVPASVWADLLAAANSDKRLIIAALGGLSGVRGVPYIDRPLGLVMSDDYEIKKAATACITSMGKAALPAVHAMLGDTRRLPAAISLLAATADETSEKPLLSLIGGMDEDGLIKAVDILGRVGGPEGARRLAGMYPRADKRLRIHIMRAFGGMKPGGAVGEVSGIIKVALAGDVDELRLYAARSAGGLKLAGMKDALTAAASKERSAIIKDEIDSAVKAVSGDGGTAAN